MRKIKQFIVFFCVCVAFAGISPAGNTAAYGEETIGHLQQEVRTLNKQIRTQQKKIKDVKQTIRQTKHFCDVLDSIQNMLPWKNLSHATGLENTLRQLTMKRHNLEKNQNRDIARKEYTKEKITRIKEQAEHPIVTKTAPSHALTPQKGVVYYNGHRETYYSQRVLPGGGLNIPGRHVAVDGTIRDKDGNICIANIDCPKGTVIQTSLGPGKVYDTGCASGTVDIYTDW